jgi:hypothetical protein
MSEIRDRIRKLAKGRMLKECTVFGEKVNCRVYSMTGIDKEVTPILNSSDDKKIAEFMAKQFLEKETGKPVFTTAFIMNDMSQSDAMELLSIFSKMNGSSGAVEEAEKN